MKVRLLTSRVGRDFENHEGDEIELPDEEATTLIERGSAEVVASTPASRREKASRTQRETR